MSGFERDAEAKANLKVRSPDLHHLCVLRASLLWTFERMTGACFSRE
jgi:hypothetical protein